MGETSLRILFGERKIVQKVYPMKLCAVHKENL